MHLLLLAPTDLDEEGQKTLAVFFEAQTREEVADRRPLYKGEPLVKVHLMTTVRADDSRDISVHFLDNVTDVKIVDAVKEVMQRAHKLMAGRYSFSMSPPQGGRVIFSA